MCKQLGFSPLADVRHDRGDVIRHYLGHRDSDTLLELLQLKSAAETAHPPVERR
jgi:hypothetical protein